MKKLVKLLLSLIVIASCFVTISASEETSHINLSEYYQQYIDHNSLVDLEDDLNNIKASYGLDIYFIYDESIADDQMVVYGDNFLSDNGSGDTNIIMLINENCYYIKASGTNATIINGEIENIWNAYKEGITLQEKIVNYYQKVVAIVNKEVYQVSVPLVDGQPIVVDMANIFSEEEIASLEENITIYKNSLDIDLVVVTTNDLAGLTNQQYADDFYDYNNYKDDGALLLIAFNPNYVYISTKGDGINFITDWEIEDILDDVCQYLPDNFYKASMAFAKDVFEEINEGRKYNADNGGEIDKPYIVIPEAFDKTNVIIAVAGGAIIALIVILVLTGQLKSVKTERYARNYIVKNSFQLTGYSDVYLRTDTTRSAKPKNDGGSHHSGGGSSHTSSSGSSHGGGGRSF